MPAATSSTYALILAGGSGTRFWPLSRNARPKQLLNLFGPATMLGQTIGRLAGLVPLENILVLTNQLQLEAVRAAAPQLPAANIIAEPAKRDTAPAVALGIALIAARDPGAPMLVLPADHLINDVAAFQGVLGDAISAAVGAAALVTIGIKPTWACPAYGYIQRGAPAEVPGPPLANVAFEVLRFREKPAPELAQQYLAEGGFSWNAGMFIWTIPTVVRELESHAPQLAGFIRGLCQAADPERFVAEEFAGLTPISIDFALMEKASRVLNLEATFDWDDVGSWISVAKYLDADAADNRSNEPLTQLASEHNIVFNARKGSRVALLGVAELIVVQTEDALLIAHRDQAEAIKHLTDRLPAELL